MVIEHCPTEKMLGDHFTKPLQGALFRKFRAEIMKISDYLDMGGMGMDVKVLKGVSRVNCITRPILDATGMFWVLWKSRKGKLCYGVLKYRST